MLVRDDAHRFKVIGILTLTRRLLHLLVRNLKARKLMSSNQTPTITRCYVSLVMQREIACRSAIGIVLRHDGVQVMFRHVAGSAAAQRAIVPGILRLRRATGSFEAPTE